MATGDRPDADICPPSFGCDLKELKEVMQMRGADAHDVISSKYDGVTGFCARLKTHPTQGKFLVSLHTELDRGTSVQFS